MVHPSLDTNSGTDSVRALVVGATGGIGFALVRSLLSRSGTKTVTASYRPGADLGRLQELERHSAGSLRLLPLDFTEKSSVDAFRERLLAGDEDFSLVIHAAGMLHEGDISPEKSFDRCEANHLARQFEINSIGPLMVAKAVLSTQSRKSRFTFAALSAMVGSIGDNRLGGWYGYRASKAALNQFVRTLAMECRSKFPGSCIVSIHPGTTDTRLSRPFQARIADDRLYAPEKSAERILSVTDGLGPECTGRFYNWDGTQIEW